MKVMSLLIRHLGATISALGSVLIIASFFFPIFVTNAGKPISETPAAAQFLMPELLVALIIFATSVPAIFYPISPLIAWMRAIVTLLNIPLFLFIEFIVGFATSGGSPDGGVAIQQAGGEVPGPGLWIIGFGVLITVIGFLISLVIAGIEKIGNLISTSQVPQ